VSFERLIFLGKTDKGKPAARRGRKAHGPPEEVAGLPKPKEHRRHGQARDREQWEPGAALTRALEGSSLLSGTSRDGDLARLEPHLREALGELGRLEQQRGLSGRERVREEALGMLLAFIEQLE
jgi:hypothetical protein